MSGRLWLVRDSGAGRGFWLRTRFGRQHWGVSWTAVVLPGGGYGPVGAVLRLPVLALEGAGARTVVVDYPSPGGARDARWWSAFGESVRSQVAVAVASAGSGRVTFVAKSLGSVALAGLDRAVVGAAVVDAIWLTPLFGEPEVRCGAIGLGWRSLLVAGGADTYHEPGYHDTVRRALGASSLVLGDADHSLEVPGDAVATADRFRQLAEAVTGFVEASVVTP
jgi:hypothetical protein